MANYIGNRPVNGVFKRLDSISSQFNGSSINFSLLFNGVSQVVGDASQLIVSLNSVILEPLAGYTLGTGGSNIIFSSAPANGQSCFIVMLGGVGGAATPTLVDSSIITSKINNGAVTSAKITIDNDLNFPDNEKAIFGAGSDLQIYHDGAHSRLKETGTGGFYFDVSNSLFIRRNDNSALMASFETGTAKLYHENALKLKSTSTGVDITGTLVSDGLTVDGTGVVGTFSSSNNNTVLRVKGNGATNGGAIGSTSTDDLVLLSGLTEKMRITSAGNVGIGTSSPVTSYGRALQIHNPATTGSNLRLTNSTTGEGTGNGFELIQLGVDDYIINREAGAIITYTNGGEVMRIDSSGNLLVGKTSADTYNNTNGIELQASGLLTATRTGIAQILNREDSDGDIVVFRKDGTTVGSISSRGGNAIVIASQGKSGINFGGTSINPWLNGSITDNTVDFGQSAHRYKNLYLSGAVNAATLNVDGGTIKLDGNYPVGTGNVALGDTALDSLTSGTINTAVGNVALTANTTGYGNAAFGDRALTANIGGLYNTAVGTISLSANTSGSNNVAVGGFSLDANTTSSNNTAVGFAALSANTTASNNTAVGYQAAYSTTTGTQNTAVGRLALYSNTTGEFNIAVGNGTLENNTTASYNTAVGYQAGYTNVTGSPITALGYRALFLNTASDNTAVGYSTLQQNSSGSANTGLGHMSLHNNTTASNNTALGYQALYDNTTGASNTGIGSYALTNVTTGANNTALGKDAALNTTTANANVAVGRATLYTNSTGASNTALGETALYSNTTASNNTAVGYQAGYANTTGDIDAFGYQAGLSNTTGLYNLALGQSSLANNTTGASNISVGRASLIANTTGSSNVAVGHLALLSNTTASSNTAVGYQAGTATTTGASNAFFGRRTAVTNTTGASNAAFGANALSSNTTGGQNVAIGESALTYNTTASNNTAVGYQAGYSGTTSAGNTLIGKQAGYALTTANGNTFIGSDSGDLVTTGQNNTILGRYSGNQGGLDIRTSSNNIVLSDGDGVPKWYNTNQGRNIFNTTAGSYSVAFQHSGAGGYGVFAELSNANHNHYFAGYNGSSYDFVVGGGGNVTNTNNSYGGISDVKLKENISDASSQWDDVKALSIRKYSMKTDNLNEANQLGVIAQEVEAAGMGGLVETTSDIDRDGVDLGTETKAVKYSILYMKAVKALQEAMDRIETLEAKVTALENA